MITPIRTMTVDQICERKDDLLVSADDIKELARNERNKAISEFAERLKEKAEEIMQNPDIMLDCKKCTIWKVKDIDEIAGQLKGGAV